MRRSFRSDMLVILQFICLVYLLLSGTLLAKTLPYILLEICALILMAWGGLTLLMFSKLRVTPEVAKGNKLVTSGPYEIIRHPIYSGFILFTFSLVLSYPTPFRFLALLTLFIVIAIKIKIEEKELEKRFPHYKEYEKKTKRIIPFVF